MHNSIRDPSFHQSPICDSCAGTDLTANDPRPRFSPEPEQRGIMSTSAVMTLYKLSHPLSALISHRLGSIHCSFLVLAGICAVDAP
jgi:hypothetical protein